MQLVCHTCGVEFQFESKVKFCSRGCSDGSKDVGSWCSGLLHTKKSAIVGVPLRYDSHLEFSFLRNLCLNDDVVYVSSRSDKTYNIVADYVTKDGSKHAASVVSSVTTAVAEEKKEATAALEKEGVTYHVVVPTEAFDWHVAPKFDSYTNDVGTFERPSLEYTMMKLAVDVAKRSTCLRNKVGAVLCDSSHFHVRSFGYNGDEPGGRNMCDSLEPGSCGCMHAEATSVVKARVDAKDHIIYTTVAPCVVCARVIVTAGISKVVYLKDYRDKRGLELLLARGVVTQRY